MYVVGYLEKEDVFRQFNDGLCVKVTVTSSSRGSAAFACEGLPRDRCPSIDDEIIQDMGPTVGDIYQIRLRNFYWWTNRTLTLHPLSIPLLKVMPVV